MTELSEVHPEKTLPLDPEVLPSVTTLSGMVIEVREVHPSKACTPIDVTVSGMVIEVRDAHL